MRPLRCFRTARDLPCGRTATTHSKRVWSPYQIYRNSGSDTLDIRTVEFAKTMAHGWCLSVFWVHIGTYTIQTYQIYQELNQGLRTFTLDSYGFFPMMQTFQGKEWYRIPYGSSLGHYNMAGWIPSHFTRWLFLDRYYKLLWYMMYAYDRMQKSVLRKSLKN